MYVCNADRHTTPSTIYLRARLLEVTRELFGRGFPNHFPLVAAKLHCLSTPPCTHTMHAIMHTQIQTTQFEYMYTLQ